MPWLIFTYYFQHKFQAPNMLVFIFSSYFSMSSAATLSSEPKTLSPSEIRQWIFTLWSVKSVKQEYFSPLVVWLLTIKSTLPFLALLLHHVVPWTLNSVWIHRIIWVERDQFPGDCSGLRWNFQLCSRKI